MSGKDSPLAGLLFGTAVGRAFRLRCPRCGVGVLFKNLIIMHERCPNCSLKYERAPGYFLGSTYINYGIMAISVTSIYMLLHYGASISNEALTIPLMIYCTVVPILLFRYARAWWLAMDCYNDPTGFGLLPTNAETDSPSDPPH